jgi:transcriptional regulator with XRE-family HTH domain
MDIAGLLRAARHDMGLTQRGLAARLGVAPSSLSRFESGAATPSLRMVERVLEGCGRDAQWTLVQRHADLDAELTRRAGLSPELRLQGVALLTPFFVTRLGQLDVLIGGAWAAALHGLPHEDDHAKLWFDGGEAGVNGLAELLRERIAFLYVDGHPTSPEIRPSTLLRHPQAEWVLRLVGSFSTTLVPPGGQWPAEVRMAGPEGPLRVVPAEHLTVEDGVRPEILERWSALRSPGGPIQPTTPGGPLQPTTPGGPIQPTTASWVT